MNSLKPLFTIVALGLVSAVVYVAISRPSKDGPPPPEAAAYTDAGAPNGAPAVQFGAPGSGGPYGSPSAQQPGAQTTPRGANPYSGVAPSYAAGPGGGQSAPAYNPQGSAGQGIAATAPPYGSQAAAPTQAPGGDAPPYSPSDPPSDASLPPMDQDNQAGQFGGDAPPFSAGGAPSSAEHDDVMARSQSLHDENAAEQPPADDIAAMFDAFMGEVQQELAANHLAEAHLALSRFYRRPGLTPEQSAEVTDLLDQLAGTVIYSREHHLEPPHVVRPGETLEDIAEQYEVPWQLLANINRIDDPHRLRPGEELKVVRGPFHAEVHLADREMTVMLGRRYAGRFPIGVGHDVPPEQVEGPYQVDQKTVGPSYVGPDGLRFRERDPRNPLGGWQLALSRPGGEPTGVSLHGTNDPGNVGRSCERGTICLDDRDIQDVYAILSVGSRVTIRR
jgi:LysM repeat protein